MRNVSTLLEPLCSAAEAAKIVGVTPQSVRMYVKERGLDADSSLGVLVVRRADVLKWKADRVAAAQQKLAELL